MMAAKRKRRSAKGTQAGTVLRNRKGERLKGFPLPDLEIIRIMWWVSREKGLARVQVGYKGDDGAVLGELVMIRNDYGFRHRDIGEIRYRFN